MTYKRKNEKEFQKKKKKKEKGGVQNFYCIEYGMIQFGYYFV